MATETQEWIDGFLMVGNQPALDLLNTALVSDGGPVELLPDTRALEHWLVASGLVTTPRLKASLREWRDSEEARAFLRQLLAFRDHLRAAVLRLEAGKMPGADFLAELNQLLQAHPVRAAIGLRNGRLEQEQAFGVSMADNLWALFAAQTAALFTNVQTSRIRKCESCVVHFNDVSKKGSRRWCSMNLCGNKVKVAAYQRRQRTENL